MKKFLQIDLFKVKNETSTHEHISRSFIFGFLKDLPAHNFTCVKINLTGIDFIYVKSIFGRILKKESLEVLFMTLSKTRRNTVFSWLMHRRCKSSIIVYLEHP